MHDNSWVTIDLDVLSENMAAISNKAGIPVMAVIKADAYGHGAVQVAKALENQCPFFGVSSLLEALELRNAGIVTPILILGPIVPENFAAAIRNDIRPVIFRWEDAQALSDTAVRLNRTARFHFAVDTGMSRIGFQVSEESADICREICNLPGLYCEGIFSHFATADSWDLTRTQVQAERFARFDALLANRGVHPEIRHLDNSAGIMNYPHSYEMVRSGIITYGLYPSDEVDRSRLSIHPALRWDSRISHLKTLEPGREISYGGTYVTTAETRVATIPVGYADGYRRSLSGKFYVLIHGKRAPILGRICMDQMMVDVTGIPEASLGDVVTLIGKDGEEAITVEEIAANADSFNYEFVCGISRRVPRLYLRDGKIDASVHYLLD